MAPPMTAPRAGLVPVQLYTLGRSNRGIAEERAGSPSSGELLLKIPQDDGEFERLSLAVRRVEPAGVARLNPSSY